MPAPVPQAGQEQAELRCALARPTGEIVFVGVLDEADAVRAVKQHSPSLAVPAELRPGMVGENNRVGRQCDDGMAGDGTGRPSR